MTKRLLLLLNQFQFRTICVLRWKKVFIIKWNECGSAEIVCYGKLVVSSLTDVIVFFESCILYFNYKGWHKKIFSTHAIDWLEEGNPRHVAVRGNLLDYKNTFLICSKVVRAYSYNTKLQREQIGKQVSNIAITEKDFYETR